MLLRLDVEFEMGYRALLETDWLLDGEIELELVVTNLDLLPGAVIMLDDEGALASVERLLELVVVTLDPDATPEPTIDERPIDAEEELDI